MKNRDVKRLLKSEARQLVPDHFRELAKKTGISEAEPVCTPAKKSRKRAFAVGSAAFAAALCLAVVLPLTMRGEETNVPVAVSASVVTIDINPSVEIAAGKDDVVTGVRALNKEGVLLLFSCKTDLIGQSVSAAGRIVVECAKNLNYLSPGREVKVSAVNENPLHEKEVTEAVAAEIGKAVPDGIVVTPEEDRDIAEKAKAYGVTSGKMRLAVEAARVMGMEERAAAALSASTLNELIRAFDPAATNGFQEKLRAEGEKLELERERAKADAKALASAAERLEEAAEEAEDLDGEDDAAELQKRLAALNAGYRKLLEELTGEPDFGVISEETLGEFGAYLEDLTERLELRLETLEREYDEREEEFEKSVKEKLDEDGDYDFDDEDDD